MQGKFGGVRGSPGEHPEGAGQLPALQQHFPSSPTSSPLPATPSGSKTAPSNDAEGWRYQRQAVAAPGGGRGGPRPRLRLPPAPAHQPPLRKLPSPPKLLPQAPTQHRPTKQRAGCTGGRLPARPEAAVGAPPLPLAQSPCALRRLSVPSNCPLPSPPAHPQRPAPPAGQQRSRAEQRWVSQGCAFECTACALIGRPRLLDRALTALSTREKHSAAGPGPPGAIHCGASTAAPGRCGPLHPHRPPCHPQRPPPRTIRILISRLENSCANTLEKASPILPVRLSRALRRPGAMGKVGCEGGLRSWEALQFTMSPASRGLTAGGRGRSNGGVQPGVASDSHFLDRIARSTLDPASAVRGLGLARRSHPQLSGLSPTLQ